MHISATGVSRRRFIARALRASAISLTTVASALAVAPQQVPAQAPAHQQLQADYDMPITALGARRHRAAVTRLVNAERTRRGLAPLLASAQLERSARAWAIVTSRRFGELSHGDFARRAQRFPFVIAAAPGVRRYVGENLAFGSGELSTPREIVWSWMHSPGHRANLLRGWRYGAVWSSRSGDAVAVVHHFGRERGRPASGS